MKNLVVKLSVISFLLGSANLTIQVKPSQAAQLSSEQRVFTEMLRSGQYYFPEIESGILQGQIATFEEAGVSVVNSPGWFRSFLKGVGVASAGIAGGVGGFLVGGPVGAGVGAGALGLGYKTYVDDLNRQGPGPGREWLISDARLYQNIIVEGTDILPNILASAQNNVVATANISSLDRILFINTSVFPTRILDETLSPINTVEASGLFIIENAIGSSNRYTLGSFVLNKVGFADIPTLDNNDYLDIELGAFLSIDGLPIQSESTLIVGYQSIPTPESNSVLGLLALSALGAGSVFKRKLKSSKSTEKETPQVN